MWSSNSRIPANCDFTTRASSDVYSWFRILTPCWDIWGWNRWTSAFNVKALKASLTSRKRLLKPLLLDQTVIAGLGNIYVDEALWEAGLHPCRRSHTLSGPEINALRRAIPRVLKRGLEKPGHHPWHRQGQLLFHRPPPGTQSGSASRVPPYRIPLPPLPANDRTHHRRPKIDPHLSEMPNPPRR